EDIHIFTSIPLEELVYYYKNAELFLNASIFEGFGFTPFEAINFGLPSFLFKNSVVAEIIGEHPYVFADFNIRKWAGRIMQEMENGYKNKIPSSLLAHLTWRRSAEQFLEIFNSMFFSREAQFATQK
ncbi:MAG: glycosyltransferase, partial [Calditrichia bacterium]